ncbi:hypothetical protein [Jiella sonneratiae]|uniref:Uncharacterized protein n=1 Tax=Jiella sonneratiae TaxID=2816856 RepID=A0ABS3J6Z8_9HYPH|nr:hypothetical protein [Jiella sonneratiae]MBO0904748.1 hypothetical protein [Jiella sonneratiae]
MPNTLNRRLAMAAAAAAAVVLFADGAAAKPARCFTTDDGYYSCNFQGTDAAGSFEISAPGKPTFSLLVDRPGFASAYADYGTGRNVALPGMYVRERDQPACWSNPETVTKICAW